MIRQFMLALCLAALPGQGHGEVAVNLGSGHRGLMFTWMIPSGPGQTWDTVAFALNLNPGFPVESAYLESHPDMRILLKETLSPEYLKQFDPRFWAGWTTCRLYSFGPDAAFSDWDLYRIEDGHIRIYPGRAQAEARKTYGLTPEQRFLGAFNGRVFYWIKNQPHEVYCQAGGQLFRFKLEKRVTEPIGMSNGEPLGDLALFANAKPRGWFSWTPRDLDWRILNFKDAERLR